jgi:Flp pilus assembly protein CpaB
MRPLRHLRRYPLVWWLATITVAGVSGLVVTNAIASAAESAERFGGLTTVAVATRALAPGDTITTGDVRTESRPQAFLPGAPVVLEPLDRTVRVPVFPGDVLTDLNVGDAGLSPAAALLEEGEQGISVKTDERLQAFRTGDRVDVLGTIDEQPTTVVASNVRVIGIDESTVTIAIPTQTTPAVATAMTRGTITLALTR